MVSPQIDRGNAALGYAQQGLAVFPVHWIRDNGTCSCGKAACSSPGKHPVTQRGCLDATTDADSVRQWWDANPQANIGMATGEPSGVWALDVEADGLGDLKHLKAINDELPDTAMSVTGGGGLHLFFRHNGDAITSRAKLGGYAIDVRGDGGYVLLPPSNHASGASYLWHHSLDEYEPEHAPQWLLDFVTQGAGPSGGGFVCQPDGFANAPASAKGSRHNDLVKLVGTEFARGKQFADVMRDALAWAKRCGPPHDEQDVRQVVEDLASREFAKLQAEKTGETSTVTEPFGLSFLTASEFESTDYAMRFLVKGALVAGQPALIGGPKKSLKTSIIVDLAVSLGTGRPLLGFFDVPNRATVGVMSGESGGFTLKETARRIALSKGVTLGNSSTHWSFDLPTLTRADHLNALVDVIREREFDVTILDPAYLCLLDDGRAESAANVFSMGSVLKRFAEVGTETGTTLVLCHHSTKAAGRSHEPMELEDLSQSGFAEFARQWLLVSRRGPFEYGSGQHKLWLSVGGSAGHSGLYGIDVDEGRLRDDFTGRFWDVNVTPANQLIASEAAERAERRRQEADTALQTRRADIVKAMKGIPDGDTKRGIRDLTTLNNANFNEAFATLTSDGTVVSCEVRKANGRVYDGFKLSTGTTGTGQWDKPCPDAQAHSGTTPPLGGVPPVCAPGVADGEAEVVPVDEEFEF